MTLDSFFKKNGLVGGIVFVALFIAIAVILWNRFTQPNIPQAYETLQQRKQPVAANMNNPIQEYQKVSQTQPTPNQLLPKDTNSEWNSMNPSGSGELPSVMFKAGWPIGIDTIGQSMKNGNLQLRSEPPCPQGSVGPWNQSSFAPDYMRPPLEIGQGPQ